jgi:LytR cell envelope-related transcriptional attenuator
MRALIVFLLFLALFFLVDRLSGPRDAASPPRAGTATTKAPPASTAAATTTTAPPTTTTARTTTTTTTRAPSATSTTRAPAGATPLKSAEGVTVQILNGTGELRLARDFKPAVRAAGYRIVNTGNSAVFYEMSTVYYTDDNRDDALSFRRRFPAFSTVARAPANLSSSVELHVIIGANFEP